MRRHIVLIAACVLLIVYLSFCYFDFRGAKVGMTLSEFEKLMPQGDHYEAGRYFQERNHIFYPNLLGYVVVAETNFSQEQNAYVIAKIRIYRDRLPLHISAGLVKEGMSKTDVVNLLGSPVGWFHSGLSVTEFNTLDGSLSEVYWSGTDGTVSGIVLAKDNRWITAFV